MAKKAPIQIPHDRLSLYLLLLERHPDIERKGVNMAYTSHNGHVFSLLDKEGNMGLRLPPDILEHFIEKYDTEHMTLDGTVMNDYVRVPPDMMEDTNYLFTYLQKSYDFVNSLKPRPPKKKKKS